MSDKIRFNWRLLRRLFGIIVLVAFLVWAFFLLRDQQEALLQLLSVSPLWPLLLAILTICFLFSNGLQLKEQLKVYEAHMTWAESWHLSVVANAGNTFLPLSAGLAARAVFLKERYSISLTKFTTLTLGGYIISFLCIFLVGSVGSFYFFLQGSQAASFAFVVFVLGTLFFLFFPSVGKAAERLPDSFSRLRTIFVTAFSGYREICANGKVLTSQIFISVSSIVLATSAIWVSLRMLGIEVTFWSTFLLSALNSLAIFVKITPANLGVNEALLVFGGQVIQVPPESMILASALNRVIQILVLLGFFPFSGYSLYGKHWLRKLKTQEKVP